MTRLPTLYKRASTGKIQHWTCCFDGATYWSEHGSEGGKTTIADKTVCVGKNVGRSNETTPAQQAEAEARAKWTLKLKKDYVKTKEEALAGESSELIEGGILPMLAHKFSDHGDKLVYPCFVQPKLDGHRCIAVIDHEGECTLWSRTRKPINSVPHIVRAIKQLKLRDTVLDGELYNHDYRNNFEKLTHFIRQSEPEAGCEIVQYHVYDMAIPGAFRSRGTKLHDILGVPYGQAPLRLVETREVDDEDELMLVFEDFLARGYEGAIARNAAGLYVNKRSTDLLKIKQFDDREFKCVDVEEGRGKMAGHAIFVCTTDEGVRFSAKMKGEHDALARYIKKPDLVIGRLVTVKYQGLTNKNKVPRFPVALRVREDV